MKHKLKPQPFFDDEGNLYIPNNLKFGGEMNPPLRPREWFYYVLINTKNIPTNEDYFIKLVGSKSTIWRAKKSLKKKGYL